MSQSSFDGSVCSDFSFLIPEDEQYTLAQNVTVMRILEVACNVLSLEHDSVIFIQEDPPPMLLPQATAGLPLPAELWYLIFRDLGLKDLFSMARVNRLCREYVLSTPEMEFLLYSSSGVLPALSSRGPWPRFTLAEVHDAFRLLDCSLCGDAGGYLFLPTLERCCFDCVDVVVCRARDEGFGRCESEAAVASSGSPTGPALRLCNP